MCNGVDFCFLPYRVRGSRATWKVSADPFASSSDFIVPHYFTWYPELLAKAVDALSQQDWTFSHCQSCHCHHRECCFVFPPRQLLPRVLRKAEAVHLHSPFRCHRPNLAVPDECLSLCRSGSVSSRRVLSLLRQQCPRLGRAAPCNHRWFLHGELWGTLPKVPQSRSYRKFSASQRVSLGRRRLEVSSTAWCDVWLGILPVCHVAAWVDDLHFSLETPYLLILLAPDSRGGLPCLCRVLVLYY